MSCCLERPCPPVETPCTRRLTRKPGPNPTKRLCDGWASYACATGCAGVWRGLDHANVQRAGEEAGRAPARVRAGVTQTTWSRMALSDMTLCGGARGAAAQLFMRCPPCGGEYKDVVVYSVEHSRARASIHGRSASAQPVNPAFWIDSAARGPPHCGPAAQGASTTTRSLPVSATARRPPGSAATPVGL